MNIFTALRHLIKLLRQILFCRKKKQESRKQRNWRQNFFGQTYKNVRQQLYTYVKSCFGGGVGVIKYTYLRRL